ncbi:hypothetical protein GCM10022280_09170 [Sphingomonas swuensis]|uniref:Uncharacterized protein n=1 Tax=Sphingomonas swuensis TaxID=977800 RepID=A0ABP7SKY6_9SPHN
MGTALWGRTQIFVPDARPTSHGLSWIANALSRTGEILALGCYYIRSSLQARMVGTCGDNLWVQKGKAPSGSWSEDWKGVEKVGNPLTLPPVFIQGDWNDLQPTQLQLGPLRRARPRDNRAWR